ncbi:hypothetical protein EVU96_24780 [Bacillus infantis]|uniref:hypothetical protein n=1 Tax=Bacillus infantis TaxID=324767 RepID=UPI00101C9DF4|nr:hypothetical protein [Bacillus infantis]RYI25184.1 hypothetical protein EVU96_24780 [Bacillus infantis]
MEKFREDTILVDDEELYPVPNHPGFYVNFELGKVFNTFSEKYLGLGSMGSKRTGYVYVTMKNKNGEASSMSEHWAVYSAYTGIPKNVFINNGLTLHHVDGVKNNNSIFNLIPVRHKDQYKDEATKERLKNRSNKRLSESDKDTLEAAWEILDDPKRSEFVNEWSEKLDIHWRTIDNYVKEYFIN